MGNVCVCVCVRERERERREREERERGGCIWMYMEHGTLTCQMFVLPTQGDMHIQDANTEKDETADARTARLKAQ
jgi:hypothetical protein